MSFRALALLALLATPAVAGDLPTILTVPGDSDTIQGAIDMARGPTLIKVKKGLYAEAVVLSNRDDITLLGKGKPAIKPATSDAAINIADCSNILIQGFKLEHATSGVEITGSDHVTVRKCQILAMELDGVHALDSSFLTIEKNKVAGTGQFGLDIGDVPGVSDCLVTGNKVEDTDSHGILLGGARNTAEKNKVTRAGGHGVEIRSLVVSSECIVRKNVVKEAGAVGLLCNGTAQQFEKNKVVTSGDEGLLVADEATGNTITGNTLSRAGTHGLHVEGDDNSISGNKVRGALEHGVFVEGNGNGLEQNSAVKSASDGFHVLGIENLFTGNKAKGSGDLDLEDENARGANIYALDNVFPDNNIGL